MDSTGHTFTASGYLRKPDITTVCTWIKVPWDELASSIVTTAFKQCSISNALDRTEDHLVYEDDSDGDEDPFQNVSESGTGSVNEMDLA